MINHIFEPQNKCTVIKGLSPYSVLFKPDKFQFGAFFPFPQPSQVGLTIYIYIQIHFHQGPALFCIFVSYKGILNRTNFSRTWPLRSHSHQQSQEINKGLPASVYRHTPLPGQWILPDKVSRTFSSLTGKRLFQNSSQKKNFFCTAK